VKLGMEVG